MRYLRTIRFVLAGTCAEVSRLISDECDRPLQPAERWSSRLHRINCKSCRRFRVQVQHLQAAVKERRLEPALTADAKQRIAQRLSDVSK
ncbi:MAG: hypothetical protein AAF593_13910 [Planctomycetota bacterium]